MAAPLCKTEAIAVRSAAWSETSRIVTWITRDFGRLATVLKGAQRPRNAFLGQVDLLYTCEVVFYHSMQHGVTHVARECAPLKMRTAFRTDWRALAAASYLADLVARAALVEAPHGGLYRYLDGALDLLAARPRTGSLLLWLELKLLDQLGLTPRLGHCAGCGRELEPGRTAAHLSPARGGILCAACAALDPAAPPPARPDLLATLQFWQRSDEPGAALNTRLVPRQREELERFLGGFLVHHLDLQLPGRAIAFDLANRPRPATAAA